MLSHAQALLATSDGVSAVAADLRDPGALLADPQLRAVIDPARPMCVILGAVLHFLDAAAARAVTAGYTRLMTPGSCLAVSVARLDDEGLGKLLAAEYTAAACHNHTPADVVSFFVGLELVGRASPKRPHGRPGCPSPCCGTVRATCWPPWHGAKPDPSASARRACGRPARPGRSQACAPRAPADAQVDGRPRRPGVASGPVPGSPRPARPPYPPGAVKNGRAGRRRERGQAFYPVSGIRDEHPSHRGRGASRIAGCMSG